jgi:hypothetical protein
VVWWEEHGKDGEYFTGKAVLAGMAHAMRNEVRARS